MWEEVARKIRELGGEILTGHNVDRLYVEGNEIRAVGIANCENSKKQRVAADYVFSTMPVKELVRALDMDVPTAILEISDGLLYRDFITVGLLLKKLIIVDNEGE